MPGNTPHKRALLIAFHYPPVGASSGVQRALAFSRYLGDYGWEPIVLTVRQGAYELVQESQLGDIPPGIVVKRVAALDAQRHLAVRGYYPSWLATPDRYATWIPGGVIAGIRLIRHYRPSVIWSTFPVATAHLIAYLLRRLTGVAWIADCRDPLTEPDYAHRRMHLWLERRMVSWAARVTFTTPSTLRMYADRYATQPSGKWLELPNGYDEELFQSAVSEPAPMRRAGGHGSMVLLHSGVIYPNERDPRPFFQALAILRNRGRLRTGDLRVVLRATGHDAMYRPMLTDLGIADLVELAPAVPYQQALREMRQADALLVLQGASCNIQIPAKVYEYLRADRPVFAMTDPAGDTAALLRAAGVHSIVAIDDAEAIARELDEYLARLRLGTAPVPAPEAVRRYSRRLLTGDLARCFDGMLESGSPAPGISRRA